MKYTDRNGFKWTFGTPYLHEPGWTRHYQGPCPRCGSLCLPYGGAYSCTNDYCQNSANIFACGPDKTPDWWNTDIDIQMDGNAWCATREGFINLQENHAGFGDTPQLAVDDLRKNEAVK